MEIQIKELESCKLMVSYVADAEQILNKRGEVITAFKKAPVPGFRPGKASTEAIKQHYKKQIDDALKRALAEDAYHNTLFEKKLKPHGAPKFNNLLLVDGKFTCEFEMFTKPDFTLAPFKDIEIPKPAETVNELQLTEKMLQELRVRFGEAIPYSENDFVQSGDNVILDYDGFVDGVKQENLSAVGEMLTIGNSQLKSFDDALLGMTMGETREFDIVVPENGLPSLANKTIHFKAIVNMGSKTNLCPLDDSLAQKIGKNTLIELREFVAKTAIEKVREISKNSLVESIANRLIKDNEFEVPNWIVLSEAQYLAHQSNLDWMTISDEDKEKFLKLAKSNSKLALILDRIREEEPEAQLTDQEIFDMIKKNIINSKVKTPIDDVIKEMNRTGYLQILFSRIKDEHTLDFIIKSVKITE